MARFNYPTDAKNSGFQYWLNTKNLWNAREKHLRADHSYERRKGLLSSVLSQKLTKPVDDLLTFHAKDSKNDYSFIVIGDTGEGDHSQYATLPVIKALDPDFMIINGDVAYPAGRFNAGDLSESDFHKGFFAPYKNLGIPIWAVPGNHEYYSPNEGKEFFEIFCTAIHETTWQNYGIPFTTESHQPFLYWQLMDERHNLAIIGLDTGKTGEINEDVEQIDWLDKRLSENDSNNIRTIVLFHIPALVNSDIDVKEQTLLHKTIASHSCVKLVLSAHIHNMQYYKKDEWSRFMQSYCQSVPMNKDMEYIVSGSGGAALHHTDFTRTPYYCDTFPTPNQWKDFSTWARRVISSSGLERTLVGKFASIFGSEADDQAIDPDSTKYFSMLLFEVAGQNTTCTMYGIESLSDVYYARYGLRDMTVDLSTCTPSLAKADLHSSIIQVINF